MFSRSFKIAVPLMLAAFVLQGCAAEQEEVVLVQKPTFEQTKFNLMNPSPDAVDPLEMASAASSDNVQVFPFDKGGVSVSGLALKAPEGEYKPDPSVQVFPLNTPQAQGNDVQRVSLDNNPLLPAADELLNQPTQTAMQAGVTPTSPNFVSIAAPGEPLVRIYFAHDSADLDPSSMGDISAVSARFNPNREDYVLSVEGHASVQSSEADPTRRRIINMRVATDRAYNVARALMESGIAPEKIRTVSWGESTPSGPRDGKDANAASRRVEIFRVK